MPSGFYGGVWLLEDESGRQIILYYDRDETVTEAGLTEM